MNLTDLAIFRAIYGGFRCVPADLMFALLSTSALGHFLIPPALPFLFSKVWRFEALRHIVAVTMSLSAPAFKTFFEHARPSQMLWVQPQETVFYNSFPSGHTTTVFLVAVNWSLFFKRRGNGRWIPLLILWAALVGISRIYRGVHWPSDVLGGALLGTALALALDFAWPRDRSTEVQSIEP